MFRALRFVRKLAVLLAGTAVLLVGAALLVLPGPGWLLIFAGLGLLATEFRFAAALLLRAQTVVRPWLRRASTAVGVGRARRARERTAIGSSERRFEPPAAGP